MADGAIRSESGGVADGQASPSGGEARVDDQRVVNGIFNVLRTDWPWRDLPERYGPYTTIYARFNLHLVESTSCALTSTQSGVKRGSGSR